MMYAWFSQKAFDLSGGNVYARENGEEVLITAVADNPMWAEIEYLWDDVKYVGVVEKHVRSVKRDIYNGYRYRNVDKPNSYTYQHTDGYATRIENGRVYLVEDVSFKNLVNEIYKEYSEQDEDELDYLDRLAELEDELLRDEE